MESSLMRLMLAMVLLSKITPPGRTRGRSRHTLWAGRGHIPGSEEEENEEE
jgi:hypothetical protein